MLPGRAYCCRAVKRTLRTPPEEVWITDATLVWAFQRLCLVSRPSRRHGTSAPGPMECRRRLGRRRITHYSEAARTPMQEVAIFWGIGGSKGSNSWRWEAPSPSPLNVGHATHQLPSWLMNLDQLNTNNPIHKQLGDKNDFSSSLQSNINDDIQRFRDHIYTETRLDVFSGVCETFFQSFKRSISLGQISTASLAAIIREISYDIRNVEYSMDVQHATCCSFYSAVWEGIIACKVLRIAELETEVLRLLLMELPRVPVQLSGPLIVDILMSITDNQKLELKQEVLTVGSSLFTPVTSGSHSEDRSETSQPTYSNCPLPQNEIFLDIKVMEDLAGALVKSFRICSPETATTNIRDLILLSTTYATKAIFSNNVRPLRELKEARKKWLKFIARLPSGSEDLLVEACMIIEAGDYGDSFRNLPRLSVNNLCDVLFEYWTNKGPRSSMLNAHIAFRTSILNQGNSHDSVVHLCRALEQSSIPWHEEIQCFLRVLRRLRGATASSYCCLKCLENAKIYLDTSILADELTALSKNNIRYAIDLFQCYSKGRPTRYALSLECFPDLAIAMINNPSCNPDEIWQALGGFQIWKEKRISKARIHLVKQMAFGFSQAKYISTRVAFRNVARCYRYLCYHDVPISSDIARIVTYVGVERHILEKGSISGGRLHWVLGIISRVEGEKIARRIEAAVVSAQGREKDRRTRENHLLKSGPIH